MVLVYQFLRTGLSVYSYVLMAYALVTWIPALYQSGLGRFLRGLVEPVLAPFGRFRLVFGGLDLTLFLVYILLRSLDRLLYALILGAVG